MWKTGKNGIDTWGSSSINKKEEIFKNNKHKPKQSFVKLRNTNSKENKKLSERGDID